MSKAAIVQSSTYSFRSNWNVAGVSVAGLAALLVTIFAIVFALVATGLMHLD